MARAYFRHLPVHRSPRIPALKEAGRISLPYLPGADGFLVIGRYSICRRVPSLGEPRLPIYTRYLGAPLKKQPRIYQRIDHRFTQTG